MNIISNIITLPRVLIHILKSLARQKIFIKNNLDQILENYADSGLSNHDITKIKRYYGNAVPAILGEGFCILRGKSLSKKERLAMTYLGSSTGLYDDFFDKLKTQENHILELTINPHETPTKNIHESLFVELYSLALTYSPSSSILKQRAVAVFEAQVISKLQQNSNLDSSQLTKITYLKGGVSVLFYRSVLNDIPDESEENLLYRLGSLMQLENDIFDIYKDYQDDISTLATTTKKVNDLRIRYTKLHDEVIQLLGKTRYQKKNKLYFARFVNLVICRGYVCLDCLEQNEKLTNNAFSIDLYSRKNLICDMEKPKNMIKLFYYYAISNVLVLNTRDKINTFVNN